MTSITDATSFGLLTERHRRELHIHCYRMLASFHEADDAVQETYLRAWTHRLRFDGEENFRAWLYRIATNVCLDMLRKRARSRSTPSPPEVPWLTPYPDTLLDQADSGGPDSVVVDRETIELTFLIALQLLPPRQRAALIARDILDWSASDTADLLSTSVAAANSAIQRARATMRKHLPARRSDWSATPKAEERQILERFIDAHERGDEQAVLAIAGEDIRITMPPYPWLFEGIDQLGPLMERGFGEGREGDWKLLPTWANRMPAGASYLRRFGDTVYRPFKLDVIRAAGGKISEITTFGPELFTEFGLPPQLSDH